jgi:hypothetical protein
MGGMMLADAGEQHANPTNSIQVLRIYLVHVMGSKNKF